LEWKDDGTLAKLRELEGLATQHVKVEYQDKGYAPAIDLFGYQKQALALAEEREAYAWFLEMGLGKTAIAIANAGKLHKAGKLTGVLVLAPKGVHRQWVDEQIPLHIDRTIKCHGIVWKRKAIPSEVMHKAGLTFFAMNVEALLHGGLEYAERFLALHHGRNMIIADESQLFKNWRAQRTEKFLSLTARYRRICSGTPISNGVLDLWTQFKFLDERILGHKYITSFKSRYCVFGGWENRQIIDNKNMEELYALIAPHSYRMTKAEALDLPPKMHVVRPYEMDTITEKHYKELKRTYMTWLKDGTIVDAANAAVCVLRLQQVLCGYLPMEDGSLHKLSDGRLDVLCDVVEQTQGGMVIWARFIEDARRIWIRLTARYGTDCAVLYRDSDTKRKAAKDTYMRGAARFFIANPASGGTGLDGLQHTTQSVVYYSNDFDALHRWQSEARTDRIGTKGSVTYFDIVAEGSVDAHILRTLRQKKSVSDLTLDEIRQAIGAG